MSHTQEPHRLLVVEDDGALRETLVDYFFLHNYTITTTGMADGFRSTIAKERFDLILLDLNLPDGDGLKLLREFRLWSSAPVIVVTGRRDQNSRLSALELQADDYINKPFSLHELELRVRNCLNRYHHQPEQEVLAVLGWQFNVRQQQLTSLSCDAAGEQQLIRLTSAESTCLRTLLLAKNQLVTKAQLDRALETVLDKTNADSLPVFLSRLRKKLQHLKDDHNFNPIENVPRQGYRLNAAIWDTDSPR